jgi:hypothetical protein
MAYPAAAFVGMWHVLLLTPDGSPFVIPVIVVRLSLFILILGGRLSRGARSGASTGL